MTASRSREWSAWRTWSSRPASASICWSKPACREPIRSGRSPTTRAIHRPWGRWPVWSSAASREFPPAANYQEFAFLICGRRFDPDRVDQRVRLGAVEEWVVVNEHDNDHIFHIHTNPFELTAVNGEALAQRVWRDTVVVPRNGSVTFRSRFIDFTGRFVLHCHMMNHEELGMMQVVEVA